MTKLFPINMNDTIAITSSTAVPLHLICKIFSDIIYNLHKYVTHLYTGVIQYVNVATKKTSTAGSFSQPCCTAPV